MRRPCADAEAVYKFTSSVRPFNAQTWRDLEAYRKLFPRALVVKGIMDPRDAMLRDRCSAATADTGVEPWRPPASTRRPARSTYWRRLQGRGSATGWCSCSDGGVRRGADILIAPLPGRRFLLHGPADALRRRRRRPRRGQEGDRHLPGRDRPRDGPDRLPGASTSSAPISCGPATGRAIVSRAGFLRTITDGHAMAIFAAMSTHSVAEAKNRLSQLIDRALKGEDIVIHPARRTGY